MTCKCSELLELHLMNDPDDNIVIDIDFEGEVISGSTGEEYQNGYDKGYADGYPIGKNEGITEGYKYGYDEAKAEDYIPYMASVKFSTAAEELTENISLDLSNATSIASMFEFLNVNLKKISFKITDKCTSFQNSFRTNINYVDKLEEIEIIGDTSGVTTFYRTFSGRKTLKKITGVLTIGSGVTTFHDTFGGCSSLEEVRFAPNCIALNISFKDSPNLSDETIDSIVNGLADMTGGTAIILTVHPNVKAKIESNSVWLNTIVGKNCTLA